MASPPGRGRGGPPGGAARRGRTAGAVLASHGRSRALRGCTPAGRAGSAGREPSGRPAPSPALPGVPSAEFGVAAADRLWWAGRRCGGRAHRRARRGVESASPPKDVFPRGRLLFPSRGPGAAVRFLPALGDGGVHLFEGHRLSSRSMEDAEELSRRVFDRSGLSVFIWLSHGSVGGLLRDQCTSGGLVAPGTRSLGVVVASPPGREPSGRPAPATALSGVHSAGVGVAAADRRWWPDRRWGGRAHRGALEREKPVFLPRGAYPPRRWLRPGRV